MRNAILTIILSFWIFPVSAQEFITPDVVTTLSQSVDETSGLINLNGEIWTLNDSGGLPELYRISTNDGNVIRTVVVVNATNTDWEDIANDENYVYIGDIGNNYGDRTDLKIYRVSRADISIYDYVNAEIINYSYSDQTSWEPNHNNNDFDCEALVSFQDKLYLFSKNWVNHQTRSYELSNQPGTHIAEYQATFNANCLITGSEIIPSSNVLVLIGYNNSGGSYTWLFNNFSSTNFFSGSNTKLIWTMLTQIEGVCNNGNNDIYISTEESEYVPEPTLYYQDVSSYITQISTSHKPQIDIYANHGVVYIKSNIEGAFIEKVQILNTFGTVLKEVNNTHGGSVKIPVNLAAGVYIITLKLKDGNYAKKIIIN